MKITTRRTLPITALLLTSVIFTPASAASDVDFSGIVDMRNCSASLIQTPSALDTDPALVLTNGHCVKSMTDGEVILHQPSIRTFDLLDPAGTGTLGRLPVTEVSYATMTATDVAIYTLKLSYGDVKKMRGRALELADTPPAAGANIRVASGYWKEIYSCTIDGFVDHLHEDQWKWNDAIRYTPACNTAPGASGSPVISASSGKIVGLHNTFNTDGEKCTMNNPCEVDANGSITVRPKTGYAMQTYSLIPCIGPHSKLSLDNPGCKLPRRATTA